MITATKRRLFVTTSLAFAAALTAQAAAAQEAALPSGGSVVAGQASIGAPSSLGQTITQSSQRAVINWNAFNVGSDRTVTFVQPNADAATLNRVTGNTASTIAGQISANGAVYLINPNGIQITKSGAISAGRGFVASTLDIADGDFLAGKGAFTGHSGTIDHQGSITVGQGGYVGLLGGNVNVPGLVSAPAGKVVVGAVTRATLDINGNGFLQVALPDGALLSQDGAAALVDTGAAREAVRNVVNLAPFNASSVSGSNGNVILSGQVSVDSDAGDAGSIMVMGDSTRVNGTLTARAIGATGNGGFIETSGNHVDFTGIAVDTRAAHGKAGVWLIDPTDLTVDGAAAATIASNLANGNVTLTTTSATASGPGNQSAGLGDITIDAAINWSGSTTLTLDAYHDIVVNAGLTSDGPNAGLVLRADNTGTGIGTVRFGPAGLANMSGSGGTVNIYYNPVSYASPDDFSSSVTGGTLASWMLVNTLDQLQAINTNLHGSYALTRDIDASATASWNGGDGFEPLGGQGRPFYGQFNGQGHVIRGLTINRPFADAVGLFGLIAGSTIQNVGMVGGQASGQVYAGMLVGLVGGGTIRNSYATGTVTGTDAVGGLVGALNGVIQSSYATGPVAGTSAVGGLVGLVTGGIFGSYATGPVAGAANTGGLVGRFVYGAIGNGYWDSYSTRQASACGTACFGASEVTSDPAQSEAANYAYKASAWANFITDGVSDIDLSGGQAKLWRMYDGHTLPLLKVFLTPATVDITGNRIATYDGTDQSGGGTYALSAGTDPAKVWGTIGVSGRDAGTYELGIAGLYSEQQGYDLILGQAGRLTINPRAITVVADAQSRSYGDANAALTYTMGGDGLINGDTLSGALATLADAASNVGSYAITQGSLGASANYTIAYTGANLRVDPRAITVAASAQSRTYGDANPVLTYTIGSGGLINGDTLSGALATLADAASNVGTYAINQGSLAASANYAIAYTGANLRVDPRAITVTASAQSRTYGDANPVLTYTIGSGGLVNGDELSGALATVDASANVGTHAITLGSLANANYAISYSGADLTITPRAITVTANPQGRVYGDSNPALTYTVGGDGLVNGDTLSGALATLADATSSVGTYAITQGSLAASPNYAATFTGANLRVDPRAITVAASAQSRTYGDANPVLTYTIGSGGLVNGDELSGALATVDASANVGTHAITLGSLANANYAIAYSGADLTITPRAITVTANPQGRIYGDANPALTYTVGGDGLVNGDTLSGALATLADVASNVGSYAINQGSLGASANYAIAYTGANLRITPRSLSIVANAQSRLFGLANPMLTYSATGLVNGDTLSGMLATEALQTSPVGNYAITQGSLAASTNYSVSYSGANLTVTPAPDNAVSPFIPSEIVTTGRTGSCTFINETAGPRSTRGLLNSSDSNDVNPLALSTNFTNVVTTGDNKTIATQAPANSECMNGERQGQGNTN